MSQEFIFTINLSHIAVRFIFEVSLKPDEINCVILIKYITNLFAANVLQLKCFNQAQKQQVEVFYKERCFLKFCKFYIKTTVLEPLFNKVAGLKVHNFIKKSLRLRCFLVKFTKFLRITFFTEHLRTTASIRSSINPF